MKFLIFGLLMSLSAGALADCKVESKLYPELQAGANKEVLCREAALSLAAKYAIAQNEYDVTIVANGWRTTYAVQLEVFLARDGKTAYKVDAIMNWWPGGDASVDLK